MTSIWVYLWALCQLRICIWKKNERFFFSCVSSSAFWLMNGTRWSLVFRWRGRRALRMQGEKMMDVSRHRPMWRRSARPSGEIRHLRSFWFHWMDSGRNIWPGHFQDPILSQWFPRSNVWPRRECMLHPWCLHIQQLLSLTTIRL